MNIDLDTGRLFVFLGGLIFWALLERLLTYRAAVTPLLRRVALHAAVAALNTTLMRLLIYVPLLAWIVYVEQMGWGLGRWLGLSLSLIHI